MSVRSLDRRLERLEPIPPTQEEPLVHRILFFDESGEITDEMTFTFPPDPPQHKSWRRRSRH